MSTDTDRHVGSRGAEGVAIGLAPRAPASAAELWRVASVLPGWDVSVLPTVARRLGELCATRVELVVTGPSRLGAHTLTSHDVVVALATRDDGVPCAWLELEASLARGVVDLALGGTADTAELGHVEALDATRTGVLLYMVACALASVPQEALRIVDVLPASEVVLPERLACSARVTLQGRVYGAQLSVNVDALPALPSMRAPRPVTSLPEWVANSPCQVTLELARGALESATLASLEPGDVLIPDVVTAEPGAWESATLRCDAFPQPLATVRVDPRGALSLVEAREAASLDAPAVPEGHVLFSVEAARVSVRIADVQRWLAEGRLPLDVDPHAPLTLFVGQHALARGHLVRDRGDVGLCVESVRTPPPSTRPR